LVNRYCISFCSNWEQSTSVPLENADVNTNDMPSVTNLCSRVYFRDC